MPIIVRSKGISIDHHRQGSRGMSPARAPELVAESGEEERGGFTGNTGESQEDGSENAAIRGRHDDGGDGLPFTGAESHGGFAQRVRYAAKEFFGTAKRDGDQHQAESENASERGVLPERMNDKAVSKNADDDGGHAVEQVRSITDKKSGGAAAEFGEIDGAKKSDGNTKEGSKQKHLGAAEDGVGHAAAGFTDGDGQFGEEIPVDGSSTMNSEISKNEEKDGNGDQSAHARHGQHEAAYEFAPAKTKAHARAPLPRLEVATISKRAKPLRRKVRMKSTKPSSIKDCV